MNQPNTIDVPLAAGRILEQQAVWTQHVNPALNAQHSILFRMLGQLKCYQCYPSTRLSFRESLQCLWHLMNYTTCSPTALQPAAQCKVPATVLPNLSPSSPGARHFRRPSLKLVGVNGKDRANLEISKARSA